MRVRAYTDADLESVRAMHAAQGFRYGFPDLADPLFLVRSVVEDEGRPRMAAFLRLTAEAYLLQIPAKARLASAGAGCSGCTNPCGKKPRHAAWPTCRHFCRRAWRAHSDGDSRRWGGAAIRGPATRACWPHRLKCWPHGLKCWPHGLKKRECRAKPGATLVSIQETHSTRIDCRQMSRGARWWRVSRLLMWME